MSELPNNWITARLVDLAEDISYGYTASSTRERIGPHLLRITDIQENEVLWNSVPYCEIDSEQANKYLLKENDLVFARTGATVGKSFLIRGEIPDAVFASYLIRVRCMRPEAAGYLSLYFRSQDYWRQITGFSAGIGQPNVNGSKLKELVIPLPPLAEQTRITAKLDELLAQIDTLKARIDSIPALLKRFRQSVLAAAVSGQLTEEWRINSAPTEKGFELHQQIKNAHIAEGGHARGNASNPTEEAHDLSSDDLPDSWDIAELRDVCVPGRPITYGILKPGPELEEGVPYIRVADFPGNKLNMANIKRTSCEIDQQFKRARLIEDDLLLSIRGSVGRLIKIPASLERANITQDTARLSISPLISTDFVYWALLADSTQLRMKKATRGVAVRGINIGDVRALQIPLPPRDEQTETVRRVEQLFAFADQLETRVKVAQARINHLTQSILAKAFRGELVPQDPNDEPASMLLERIKAQRAAMPKAKRGRQSAKLS
ncbi:MULTISPECIES: restriction endonuclease subunit S [Pseudomonas syringae group]|uniref:Restriction endonuclease S subunit n=1 Tax=Pseudomonas syringae pv. ribicola TaxID=55398 RepID=A0A3M2W4L1_PSESI|nr:restriction endonuclease subunit S [Pseudomonas syringae group genomosp. 3]RML45478.1 Restriction endonuclease S subunit [Pseudomonas syringae pv. ribicola]